MCFFPFSFIKLDNESVHIRKVANCLKWLIKGFCVLIASFVLNTQWSLLLNCAFFVVLKLLDSIFGQYGLLDQFHHKIVSFPDKYWLLTGILSTGFKCKQCLFFAVIFFFQQSRWNYDLVVDACNCYQVSQGWSLCG